MNTCHVQANWIEENSDSALEEGYNNLKYNPF